MQFRARAHSNDESKKNKKFSNWSIIYATARKNMDIYYKSLDSKVTESSIWPVNIRRAKLQQ